MNEHESSPTSEKLARLRYVYDSIYQLNYDDLIRYMNLVNEDEELFLAMSRMNPNEPASQYMKEFIKRLFNFLSGFYIVYDHCQSMINTCEDTDFIEVYNEALTNYRDECNYLLIRDLRTIITHIRIPPITWTTRFSSTEQSATITPKLKIDTLLEYDRISPELRTSLASEGTERLSIPEMVHSHHQSFDKFYKQIFEMIPSVWSAEMKRAYDARAESSSNEITVENSD